MVFYGIDGAVLIRLDIYSSIKVNGQIISDSSILHNVRKRWNGGYLVKSQNQDTFTNKCQ